MKKILIILIIILLSFCTSIKQHHNYIKVSNSPIQKKYLILVNHEYGLSKNYCPPDLTNVDKVDYIYRKDEVMLLNQMVLESYSLLYKEALKNGYQLTIFSAYRSYKKQEKLWENIDKNDSHIAFLLAKAGHSEHQTGLAIDISTRDIGLTSLFQISDEYKFLIDNAHLYGFINRYPKGKEYITGYYFEPWHFRYVGNEVATIIYNNKITLEEYLTSY